MELPRILDLLKRIRWPISDWLTVNNYAGNDTRDRQSNAVIGAAWICARPSFAGMIDAHNVEE